VQHGHLYPGVLFTFSTLQDRVYR